MLTLDRSEERRAQAWGGTAGANVWVSAVRPDSFIACHSNFDTELYSSAHTAGEAVSLWRGASLRRREHDFDLASSRAIRDIESLWHEQYFDGAVRARAIKLVRTLFSRGTVYAAIAPDDGGVSFYWTAGKSSIEIDILPHGDYWWSIDDVAAASFSDTGKELPLDDLRYSLKQFSKDVDTVNPHWRHLVEK